MANIRHKINKFLLNLEGMYKVITILFAILSSKSFACEDSNFNPLTDEDQFQRCFPKKSLTDYHIDIFNVKGDLTEWRGDSKLNISATKLIAGNVATFARSLPSERPSDDSWHLSTNHMMAWVNIEGYGKSHEGLGVGVISRLERNLASEQNFYISSFYEMGVESYMGNDLYGLDLRAAAGVGLNMRLSPNLDLSLTGVRSGNVGYLNTTNFNDGIYLGQATEFGVAFKMSL